MVLLILIGLTHICAQLQSSDTALLLCSLDSSWDDGVPGPYAYHPEGSLGLLAWWSHGLRANGSVQSLCVRSLGSETANHFCYILLAKASHKLLEIMERL